MSVTSGVRSVGGTDLVYCRSYGSRFTRSHFGIREQRRSGGETRFSYDPYPTPAPQPPPPHELEFDSFSHRTRSKYRIVEGKLYTSKLPDNDVIGRSRTEVTDRLDSTFTGSLSGVRPSRIDTG